MVCKSEEGAVQYEGTEVAVDGLWSQAAWSEGGSNASVLYCCVTRSPERNTHLMAQLLRSEVEALASRLLCFRVS